MIDNCKHHKITTFVLEDTGKPSGLWACAECGRKFVPIDLAMEKDAARYRWLRGDNCQPHSRRWMQFEVRCWKAPRWTADMRGEELDAAIDVCMRAEIPSTTAQP